MVATSAGRLFRSGSTEGTVAVCSKSSSVYDQSLVITKFMEE